MTPPRILPLILASGILLMLPACKSPMAQGTREVQFTASKSPWRTSVGQLQYANPKRSVIGGVVVSRRGPNDFRLEFTAGPGVPLLRLQESATLARAEGLFARGFWVGEPKKAPRHLESWVSLREIFASVEGTGKARVTPVSFKSAAGDPNPWSATAEVADGKTRRLQVSFAQTGERLTFVLGE